VVRSHDQKSLRDAGAAQMTWTEPRTIRAHLENALAWGTENWSGDLLPPESNGVYVVTLRPWRGAPTGSAKPRYVGKADAKDPRLRVRIGELLIDLAGYQGSLNWHHQGGHSLCLHCEAHDINPLYLWLAWEIDCPCPACEENRLYDELGGGEREGGPLVNAKRPERCTQPEHPE